MDILYSNLFNTLNFTFNNKKFKKNFKHYNIEGKTAMSKIYWEI